MNVGIFDILMIIGMIAFLGIAVFTNDKELCRYVLIMFWLLCITRRTRHD